MLTKRLLAVVAVFAVLVFARFANAGFNLGGIIDASTDAVKGATMSDDEINSEALRAGSNLDKSHKIAPSSDAYAKRLSKITKGMKSGSDQKFDIKVYIVKDVNAFSLANGTIRIYSMLMDKMTDDEVRYVIGHEMGHIILGHRKKQFQMAHAASAARKVGAASDNETVSVLSDSALGDFAEKLINAQFSQTEESDADQYALKVMKMNNYDPKAAVTSLRKLEKMFGNQKNLFASHPAPGDRAEAMEKSL